MQQASNNKNDTNYVQLFGELSKSHKQLQDPYNRLSLMSNAHEPSTMADITEYYSATNFNRFDGFTIDQTRQSEIHVMHNDKKRKINEIAGSDRLPQAMPLSHRKLQQETKRLRSSQESFYTTQSKIATRQNVTQLSQNLESLTLESRKPESQPVAFESNRTTADCTQTYYKTKSQKTRQAKGQSFFIQDPDLCTFEYPEKPREEVPYYPINEEDRVYPRIRVISFVHRMSQEDYEAQLEQRRLEDQMERKQELEANKRIIEEIMRGQRERQRVTREAEIERILNGKQRPLCNYERVERMSRNSLYTMPFIGRKHLTQDEVDIERLVTRALEEGIPSYPLGQLTSYLDKNWLYKGNKGMARDNRLPEEVKIWMKGYKRGLQ